GRRAGERRITHANVPKSVPKGHENDPRSVSGGHFDLWRGQDSNLRPLGYEPSELPSCSTPRWVNARLPKALVDFQIGCSAALAGPYFVPVNFFIASSSFCSACP